jgi:hypothetical protein
MGDQPVALGGRQPGAVIIGDLQVGERPDAVLFQFRGPEAGY